jgi:hypothetical protein
LPAKGISTQGAGEFVFATQSVILPSGTIGRAFAALFNFVRRAGFNFNTAW